MRAIIANNCWGAEPYKEAGMQFNTPFIGLFLYADDYIDLISSFRSSMRSEIRFVSRSKKGNEPAWPVGVIGDNIEIQFMHYRSAEEAAAKWHYRTERLPQHDDDLLFKMCDRDGFTTRHAETFDKLSFKNKICFYNPNRRDLSKLQTSYAVPAPGDECPDGVALWQLTRGKADLPIVDWLSGSIESEFSTIHTSRAVDRVNT